MAVSTIHTCTTNSHDYRLRTKYDGRQCLHFACPSTPGVLSQVLFQVSGPRSFLGIPQSQVLSQVSGSRSFPGGYPSPSQGVTQSQLGEDRGTYSQDLGAPSWDWGTPWLSLGHLTAETGVPHWLELGYPQRKNMRVSTCHATGGMPLAVTQEDCLFIRKILVILLEDFGYTSVWHI